jgi:hypothetical protein
VGVTLGGSPDGFFQAPTSPAQFKKMVVPPRPTEKPRDDGPELFMAI